MARIVTLIALALMLTFFSIPIASTHAQSSPLLGIGVHCYSPYDAPPAYVFLTFGGHTVSVFCHSGAGGSSYGYGCFSVMAFSIYREYSYAGATHSTQKGNFGPNTGIVSGQIFSPDFDSHGRYVPQSEADWQIGLCG
jgi:hypothetical protein